MYSTVIIIPRLSLILSWFYELYRKILLLQGFYIILHKLQLENISLQ
jgi:hypothetical protein